MLSSTFSFGTALLVFVLWLRLWGGVGDDDGVVVTGGDAYNLVVSKMAAVSVGRLGQPC